MHRLSSLRVFLLSDNARLGPQRRSCLPSGAFVACGFEDCQGPIRPKGPTVLLHATNRGGRRSWIVCEGHRKVAQNLFDNSQRSTYI
jgi:hypothetical protein